MFNNWNCFFTISVTRLIPCCCTIFLFTSECEVILNLISWSSCSCSFKRYRLFSCFLHITCDWYVDDWGVSTRIFRGDRCSWFYWLTWFRWIFWIWQVWFVAWDIRDNWLTWFCWIFWIIWILHFWSFWEFRIIRFWNQASKRFISNLIHYFWLFWCYCLRASFLLIGIVTCNYWNFFFAICMTSFSPCCCAVSLILLTCESIVTLNFISWSIITCSFKGYCLFGWFCYSICDWYVDDWDVSAWIFRSDRCSWFYWLTWFRWIFWIWQVWFVAWDIRDNWLTWFCWIFWIIWILHFWSFWEFRIIRFWNQAAKWFVSYSFFEIFLSDCLRSNTCFISVVTCQSWCWNCIVVSLIRCPWSRWENFTCHFIKF